MKKLLTDRLVITLIMTAIILLGAMSMALAQSRAPRNNNNNNAPTVKLVQPRAMYVYRYNDPAIGYELIGIRQCNEVGQC